MPAMRAGAATAGQDPGKAVLLAWLLPGAGHWYIGLRVRAVLYGVVVAGLFVAGIAVGGLVTASAYAHKWAFLLQVFNGPLALGAAAGHYFGQQAVAAEAASAFVRRLVSPPPSQLTDLGLTFTLVSAALNVLVLADAFYLADRPRRP